MIHPEPVKQLIVTAAAIWRLDRSSKINQELEAKAEDNSQETRQKKAICSHSTN
jgi:hypothetical protein